MANVWSKSSLIHLSGAHPLLQKLFNAVLLVHDCTILDGQRGRVAQELAFNEHHSYAHFGQSAHNWKPAIALDVIPYPFLGWNQTAQFITLSNVVKNTAKELEIPIQWGGDWVSLEDMPHYELTPWRQWAKECVPFEG